MVKQLKAFKKRFKTINTFNLMTIGLVMLVGLSALAILGSNYTGSAIYTQPYPKCSDSDGGNKANVRGTIKIKDHMFANWRTVHTDKCQKFTNGKWYSVTQSFTINGRLLEGYCKGGKKKTIARYMPPGKKCLAGRFVNG